VPGIGVPWRDNAMFLFWDTERDVYGVVHLSTSPDDIGRRARCSLAVGNRSWEIIEPLDAGTLNSASITIDLHDRIEVHGDGFDLDLHLRPGFGTVDFTRNQALGAHDEAHPLHHYQRGCRVTGAVTTDTQAVDITGQGWRDRTWGFRDESLLWAEYFALVTVLDDYALVLLKMRGIDGSETGFGWRITDTDQQPVTSFDIARDGSGLLADVTIKADTFELTLTSIRRAAGWWAPMGDRRAGPTLSTYDEFVLLETSDGQRVGGMSEHAILRQVN
jgi:hypothetical protein